MTGLLFAFLTGAVGCLVFQKFSLPVPGILGSLFFAAALNLSGYFPDFPIQWLSWFGNIVIGAYVGLQVNRTSLGFLRELPLPVFIISGGMLFISLTGGALLYWFSSLDMATAFLGSTTGGIAEMALLAMSLGADMASVTLLQVFRLLAAILVTPVVCRKWTEWQNRKDKKTSSQALATATGKFHPSAPSYDEDDLPAAHRFSLPKLFLLLAIALAGGLTGFFLRLPVGLLTGAMFSVATAGLLGLEMGQVPPVLRTMAQIGIGVVIASSVTLSTLSQFTLLAGPVILLTGIMVLCSVALAVVLHKMTGWDYPTCLLSTSLGGISQMAIIAEEMGADPLKVSILQTVRLVSILMVLPFLFNLLFH
ncbi:MAG: AbrB family transcriptional regulator [Synergistaceae bacterium]|nr:AbrB family transcriptional regulator [Synergistaceae bacterium]